MVTKPICVRPLLVLTAALAAAPLAAQEATVVNANPSSIYQERVSFADLDLRKVTAQYTLRQRVRGAVERVCRQAEAARRKQSPLLGNDGCDELTYDNARPQIGAAIRRAKSGTQLVLAMVITAPRPR